MSDQDLPSGFEYWVGNTFGNPEQFRGFVRAFDQEAHTHLPSGKLSHMAYELREIHHRMGLSGGLVAAIRELVP